MGPKRQSIPKRIRGVPSGRDLEKLRKMIDSKEYRETSRRIASWIAALDKSDVVKTSKIWAESILFFNELQDKNPELFISFFSRKKMIDEMVFMKLTGRRIILI